MAIVVPLPPSVTQGLDNSPVPSTGSGNYQPQVVDPFIQQAGSQWGVPADILKGVFGLETAFGANVKTSSAGAQGPFQFLPSTARSYNYPLTNTPTIGQFKQQANGAAHYLSDIFNNRIPGQQGNHNWDTSLKFYSGGGYGLAQVNAKAKANVNSSEGPLAGLPSAPSVPDIPGAISGAFNQAVKDAKYSVVLIGVLVVAVVLITHGLGGQSSPTNRPVPIPV